jgi:hypothetical protein
MVLAAVALAACSPESQVATTQPSGSTSDRSTSVPARCQEQWTATTQLPSGMRDLGATEAVGSGDTWMFPPASGDWADIVVFDGEAFSMKLGLFTTTSQLPSLTVVRLDADEIGTATLGGTDRRLPGPVPSTITFPTGGAG